MYTEKSPRRRWLTDALFANRIILLILLFAVPLIFFFVESDFAISTQFIYQIRVCIADELLMLTRMFSCWLLFPIFLLLLQMFLHQDTRIQMVLRSRKRRSLWNFLVLKTTVFAALMAAYCTFCAWVCCFWYASAPINWESMYALYFQFVETTSNVPFIAVLAVFFLFWFANCLQLGLLFLLLQWVWQKAVWGWLAAIFILVWDYFFSQFGLMLARNFMLYEGWLNPAVPFLNFFWALAVILLLYVIGFFVTPHKEFFNET